MTMTTQKGRPRSTHFAAAKIAADMYKIDVRTGKVFNANGEEIGDNTYEPRVSIRLKDKKYNVRVNKLVAYKLHGPEAFRNGVSVVHKNGNKWDNRGLNLRLEYTREAMKNYRRLLRGRA
jgi:hypothetical protein